MNLQIYEFLQYHANLFSLKLFSTVSVAPQKPIIPRGILN